MCYRHHRRLSRRLYRLNRPNDLYTHTRRPKLANSPKCWSIEKGTTNNVSANAIKRYSQRQMKSSLSDHHNKSPRPLQFNTPRSPHDLQKSLEWNGELRISRHVARRGKSSARYQAWQMCSLILQGEDCCTPMHVLLGYLISASRHGDQRCSSEGYV